METNQSSLKALVESFGLMPLVEGDHLTLKCNSGYILLSVIRRNATRQNVAKKVNNDWSMSDIVYSGTDPEIREIWKLYDMRWTAVELRLLFGFRNVTQVFKILNREDKPKHIRLD